MTPAAWTDEDGTEYVAIHPYLVDGNNKPVRFLRVLDEKCPSCLLNDLGVTHQIRDAETVHCTKCDWSTTRRPKPVVRPMNSGGFSNPG